MDSWTLYLPKDIDIYEEVNSPNETGNNRTLVFTTGDKEKIPAMYYSFSDFDRLGSIYKEKYPIAYKKNINKKIPQKISSNAYKKIGKP